MACRLFLSCSFDATGLTYRIIGLYFSLYSHVDGNGIAQRCRVFEHLCQPFMPYIGDAVAFQLSRHEVGFLKVIPLRPRAKPYQARRHDDGQQQESRTPETPAVCK